MKLTGTVMYLTPEAQLCFVSVPRGTLNTTWKPIKCHRRAPPLPWGHPTHLLGRQASEKPGHGADRGKLQAPQGVLSGLGVSLRVPFR